MKKLMLSVYALAAFSLLMASTGFAAGTLGIYTDPAGDPGTVHYAATPFVPFTVYLVLTDPVNNTFNGGTDTNNQINWIGGFECKVNMPLSASFAKVSENYPVAKVNVGEYPYYVVGYSGSIPVSNNAVVLCTWEFVVQDVTAMNVYLDKTRFPSIDGEMAILDGGDGDRLVPVYVSSGSVDAPVFSINGSDAVATDVKSWGNVKALFR